MSALGAFIGLCIAIGLIIKKISPTYSLILGAIFGGLIGGLSLSQTVSVMIDGIKDITPAIIRIITAGVLSGVLIKTGAAESISNKIIEKLGDKHIFLALALSTMILTGVGVFVDVAVITVAPIALIIGAKTGVSKAKLLLAMIAGGKCGNIISPNPNTIIAAENFNAPLSSVIAVNIIAAVVGLLFTIFILMRFVPNGGEKVVNIENTEKSENLPSFLTSIVAPVVTMLLLSLRPIFGISIDPLVALPVGGIIGVIAMRKYKLFLPGINYGLDKMSTVAILLVGTGTIAGVIKNSTIKDVLLNTLSNAGISEVMIAPFSGLMMSAATASTTAGATIASSSFAQIILAAGVSAVWGAAMINSSSTVLDHLPHGSFFHATGGASQVSLSERIKLIPYETAIGLVLASTTLISYFIFS